MSKQEKKRPVDRETFAAFPARETTKDKANQGKKKGKACVAFALGVLLLCLVALGGIAVRSGSRKALATTAQTGIGVVKKLGRSESGGAAYAVDHTASSGLGLIETITAPASQTTLSSGAAAYITRYRGKTYYYDAATGTLTHRDAKDGESVYQGVVRQPFYDGRFVYFIGGEGNVAGFVYRVPLSGGEAETVLPVKTTAFILYRGDLIYYDPAINALLSVPLKTAREQGKAGGEATSAALFAEVLLPDTYTTVFGASSGGLYFLDAGDKKEYRQMSTGTLTGFRLRRLDLASGDLSDVSREVYARELVVSSDALYYTNAVNGHVYRCNLKGGDIRDLTGNDFMHPYVLTVSDGYLLFRAFRAQISEEMQTSYEPIIGVCTTDGARVCAIYSVPEETSSEAVPMPEISVETDGENE